MSVTDAIDSHFKYVKARIIANNPSRTVVGILEANDWPPKNVMMNSFYLLVLGSTPSKGFGSKTNRGLTHLIQWMWIIAGDDLQQGQLGKNRGSRYRLHYQMIDELKVGLFPSFCSKNTYLAPTTPGPAVAIATGDTIWWSPAEYISPRIEEKTGLIQGSARIRINSFGDPITS